ncbi:hypothetical protein ACLBXM_23115 [Xanthobacteraceae bacterium A53D]
MAPDLPPPPYVLVQQVAPGHSVEGDLKKRALADGWSESQAGWIGKLGAAALKDTASPTPQQMDAAYGAARRRLTVGYYEDALNKKKSRLVAFLTVIDLEKQVAERLGEKAPNYSDTQLQVAYTAVEKAAQMDLSSEQQIEAGFAVLRAGVK